MIRIRPALASTMRAVAMGAVLAVLAAGCRDRDRSPIRLAHEAYVWQRVWSTPVGDGVATAPEELVGLRVLALELAPGRPGARIDVDVDSVALAKRPVTAVVRIDGSRPIADLSLDDLMTQLAAWGRAGVDVAGIEIDHDCATAALADYAAWLRRARPPAPLRWSITALPTWAGSPDLPRVAAAVDELVVQVHAVAAPRLFDARRARRWLAAVAAAIPGRAFRVALPTYRVAVGDATLAADPAELSAFVRGLERDPVPGLAGVVWFRLPTDRDLATWQRATLRAVIRHDPLVADVRAELVQRGDAFDIVVRNEGTLDAPYPAIAVSGGVTAFDLIERPRHGVLAAGTHAVAGWATGQELTVHAN